MSEISLGINKPWIAAADAPALPGHMGVFELADASGRITCIGFAGARAQFGLRSEITAALETNRTQGYVPIQYRFEVTTAYLTRYQELVMAHRAQTPPDVMPEYSTGDPAGSIRFGTLHPNR